MFTIIIIIIIIIVCALICYNVGTYHNETMIGINNIDMKQLPKTHTKINPNFIEAMFHKDYMDVLTSFGNLSPNRQIFNINNVPCKVTYNDDIQIISDIIYDLITSINDDIAKNVPLTHTVSSGWDEQLPENMSESGWEKVQKQLGLPPSLYNKPVMNTRVSLVRFSNAIKYETDSEVKYKCNVVVRKNKVRDKLVFCAEVVIPKGLFGGSQNVVIETLTMLGYLTEQGLGTDRLPTDDLYYFDCLEENNMITGKTVVNELMSKYNIKRKLMQERIDGMDVDVQDIHNNVPSPAEYDTYKVTQTIFDDIKHEQKYEQKYD